MLSAFTEDSDSGDETVFVKNLDTGEDEDVDRVLNDMSMVMIAESKSTTSNNAASSSSSSSNSNKESNSEYSLAKGEYVLEEKISPMFPSDEKKQSSRGSLSRRMSQSLKPKIPDGSHIEFIRISAVGTSYDSENKPYSIYYLEVRCNRANPPSWTVYRRYSEFRKASEKLRSSGMAVPILPPRKLQGTFEISFVRQRKQELETWLHNLIETNANNASSKHTPHKSSAYR